MTVTETPASRRAEASRRNGRLGGPKTLEGRLRASLNATKFGLSAKTYPLPHEDQAAVAGRSEHWHTYYAPQSPAAVHMTNECARATILSDRCDRHREATLAEQTRDARGRWKRSQREKAYRLVKRLATDPAGAMDELRGFARGLQWIIDEYQTFIDIIKNKGHFTQEEIDQVIRLEGIAPMPETITRHVTAYLLYTYHLGCVPAVSADELAAWVAPANRPEALRDLAHGEFVPPDAEWAVSVLMDTIGDQIELLKAEKDRIWDEEDGPSLQRKLEGASILTEEAARRVTRSHAESRTTFHRYWTALNKTLKTDAEEGTADVPAPAGDEVAGQGADRLQVEPSAAPHATAQVAEKSDSSVEARTPAQERRAGPTTGAPEDANRSDRGCSVTGDANRRAAGVPGGERVVETGADRVQNGPRLAPDATAQVAGSTASSIEVRLPAQERRAAPPSPAAGEAPGAADPAAADPPGSDITFKRPDSVSARRHEELTALYRQMIARVASGTDG